jgi:hypothetical protein
MFTLRCTQKLQRHLDVRPGTGEAARAPTTRLGDWYANLIDVDRHHAVLLVSERTLLPIVVPALPAQSILPRFRQTLAELLVALGVRRDYVAAEVAAMEHVVYARTANRRVLGSMNDLAWQLEGVPQGVSALETARSLAETPCGPIGMESPERVTIALFDAGGLVGLAS